MGYRVVGFLIETQSVDKAGVQFEDGDTCKINSQGPQEVNKDGETTLHFTYSVQWEQSEVKWASRWDVYLDMQDTQIHWFSIVNSVVVVFFLSGIITMIIIRTLRRDIAKYNMADDDIEESIEETGWKLVHGDVFRPPFNNRLFAAVIGSGIQIFSMMAITIFFAMLGMLSPASRGALLTASIFLYEFMGLVAGYYSGRLYKTMKGKEWKAAAFLTATLYPGIVSGILPFGACFIELFFIFSAIYENQFYYLFGFLFLVFIILAISCSQISVVMVYFQLCGEDYRWWWRSFVVSGGSAVYVAAYSLFYFVTKLEIDEFVPCLLYFSYTMIMVATFWLLTGTIGFYAAYTFIRKIYGAVKID